MNLLVGNSNLFASYLNSFHNSVSVASGFYANANLSSIPPPTPPEFEFLQFQSSSYPIFGVSFTNANLIFSNKDYYQFEAAIQYNPDSGGPGVDFRNYRYVVKLQGSGGGFQGRVSPYRSASPFSLPFSVRDPVLGGVEYLDPAFSVSPPDNYVQVTCIPDGVNSIKYGFYDISLDGEPAAEIPAVTFVEQGITLPPLGTKGALTPRDDLDIQVRSLDKTGTGRVIYTTKGLEIVDDSVRARLSKIVTYNQVNSSTLFSEQRNSLSKIRAVTEASVWIVMVKRRV